MRFSILAIVFLVAVQFVQAQTQSQQDTIDQVVIRANRLPVVFDKSVRSVDNIQISPLRAPAQGVSLNELLEEVPGLFVTNGFNYAQDLRLSIRGFGARSAFGIRGVKLIVDGIPETTPDGQGQVDNIDLSAIENMEVLRGASSSLYGNASGGVLAINTLSKVEKNQYDLGYTHGAFGMSKIDAGVGIRAGQNSFLVRANRTAYDGYRDHSSATINNISARWNREIEKGEIDILVNYMNSPEAQDPGGVNLETAVDFPKSARDVNVNFNSGEAIDQLKISARINKELFSGVQLQSYGFFTQREFEGYLPFAFGGVVSLDRDYGGVGINLNHQGVMENGVNQLQLGYDIGWQDDDRIRYENNSGQIGNEVFSQTELFTAYGFFIQDRLEINDWILEAGVRMDKNNLEARDQFLTNGDGSGKRDYVRFSPSLGALYKLSDVATLRASISSSFETPTLSELSADPSGTEGFNDELDAQSATNFEIGGRLDYAEGSNHLDIVVYYISTENEIVPYELEQFPGRDFYRNAGSTERMGVEMIHRWHIMDDITLSSSLNYNDFRYKDYVVNNSDLNDRRLPGIPLFRFTNSLNWNNANGWNLKVQSLLIDSIYADDANNVKTGSYHLVNLFMSKLIQTDSVEYFPFVGVNNLFDQDYFSNIRINAFGGRYYEAGPPAHIYGGIKLRF